MPDLELVLDAVARDVITAQSAASAEEVCGALLCRRESERRIHVSAAIPLEPIEASRTSFSVPVAALRAAAAGHRGALGVYHSHPAGPPALSPLDRWQATMTGGVWLIASPMGWRAWCWCAGSSLTEARIVGAPPARGLGLPRSA